MHSSQSKSSRSFVRATVLPSAILAVTLSTGACTDLVEPRYQATSLTPDSALTAVAPVTTVATPLDTTKEFAVTMDVGVTRPGAVAQRALAGSNVQWVDGADELVSGWAYGGSSSLLAGTGPSADAGVRAGPGLAAFAPTLLNAVDGLAPGALRYPGGTNADVYHWRAGVGSVTARSTGEQVFRGDSQRVLFGTGEFLALAARVDAEPVLTVNVPTGTAQEAADWVRAVNVAGLASVGADPAAGGPGLPPGTPKRVHFWEIGNEPYLREDARPELALAPAQFAQRATSYIRAMKAVDPSIAVGLPLRLDRLGTLPLVHFPGYAATVLRDVQAPVDFVALHNAYLPLVYAGGAGGARPDDATLFRATMAASRVVDADLGAVRALWRQLRPAAPLSLAVTEYNAMFTLGGALDGYVSSLGAALYTADVLRVFAGAPDLVLATQWSLNGNGIFGALTPAGVPRPTYEVLRAYARALRGRVLPVTVAGPSFASPAVGAVPAYDATPLVAAFATLETAATASASRAIGTGPGAGAGPGSGKGGRVRLVVLNKDPKRRSILSLRLPSGTATAVVLNGRAETLSAPAGRSPFEVTTAQWTASSVKFVGATGTAAATVRIEAPAMSVIFIELDLR